MNPELIILADTVHAMEGQTSGGPAPQAVAVQNGVIAAVGSRSDAEGWPAAQVIDFGAAVLTPGLVDCHMHPVPPGTGCGGGAWTPMCSGPPRPTAS
ncbi:hypothetical protein [Arthrobacter sp. 24S4-2]|uniref:hypothetical protein n=1 Tax=Arthrobacter sp. 24S4-2 TaxID=2575374 RepID=UPI0026A44C31